MLLRVGSRKILLLDFAGQRRRIQDEEVAHLVTFFQEVFRKMDRLPPSWRQVVEAYLDNVGFIMTNLDGIDTMAVVDARDVVEAVRRGGGRIHARHIHEMLSRRRKALDLDREQAQLAIFASYPTWADVARMHRFFRSDDDRTWFETKAKAAYREAKKERKGDTDVREWDVLHDAALRLFLDREVRSRMGLHDVAGAFQVEAFMLGVAASVGHIPWNAVPDGLVRLTQETIVHEVLHALRNDPRLARTVAGRLGLPQGILPRLSDHYNRALDAVNNGISRHLYYPPRRLYERLLEVFEGDVLRVRNQLSSLRTKLARQSSPPSE